MTKEFDVIIFGASGYTGQLVVEELARCASQENIKWAIAGRDRNRLQQTLVEAQKANSDNLESVKIFVSDVCDDTSVENMCKNATLVINCVGPYEKYGEPVVKACLKYNTHLIDISVEIQFINRMMLRYYHEAESQGVYMVSACGIGYLYPEMMIPAVEHKFEGGIDKVDFYVTPDFKTRSVHFATWKSFLSMGGAIVDILETRQMIYSQIVNRVRSKWSILSLTFPIKRCKEMNAICFNVPSIIQTANIGMDMREDNYKDKPIKINAYVVLESVWMVMLVCICASIMVCLSTFSYGRWLLNEYPELFSLGMVTKSAMSKEEIAGGLFNLIAVVKGRSKKPKNDQIVGNPDKKLILYGYGPPSYRNTAICVVQAAVTVLQEVDRLPYRGGVYTPLAAFSKTSLPSRLQRNGITYEEK